MSELLKSIKETSGQLEHERNLRGKTTTKCTACNGLGYIEPSREDDYGSWVPRIDCRVCGGWSRVEVACPVELTIAAMEKEVAKLKARLKTLKAKKKVTK